jgi:anti-sigma factor RsiW
MDELEIWLRHREGGLPDEERARVERRLETDAGLSSRVEGLEAIADALRGERDASFGPFFSTRVMARIARSGTSEAGEKLYDSLKWMFPRLAAACLVVILGIGVYSVLAGGYGGSVIDAVLGLPEATLATALTLGG